MSLRLPNGVATTYNDGVLASGESDSDMSGTNEQDCASGAPIVRPRRTPAQASGTDAELNAARYLGARGLIPLAKNVRCRGGEIDLILLDRDCVVFVEVRRRTNPRFGGAGESITAAKRRRIILAARWWLAGAGRRHAARPCRFDALLFDGGDAERINWIRGAFDLST